jgi:hypothetical protein
MQLDHTQLVLAALAIVQGCGLAATLAARLAEGRAFQAAWHRVYMAALLMAGSSTLLAALLGPGTCLACGASLAVMVLGATWDPGLHKVQV